MIIVDFIEELKRKEILIFFSNGKLKFRGPEEHITPELIERLKKNKGKLIKYFWPKELNNVMPINTEGNEIPLFIVHGDNGNYIISEYLGANQPVYGFFHPGSEGELIRFKNVKEMAKTYFDKIVFINPGGPFYLIGFSFGGLLAFEIAVQLQKAGFVVPVLVLIDSMSPYAFKHDYTRESFFKSIRKKIFRPLRRKVGRDIKILKCISYAFVHKPIPTKLRQFYMWDKYVRLTKKYKPDKFKGDMLLFKTKSETSSSNFLGWENLVNNIHLIELNDTHLKVFENKQCVEILQKEIKKYISKK